MTEISEIAWRYSSFWSLLEDFKKTGDKSAITANNERFTDDFYAIASKMHPVMFGPLTRDGEPGTSIFNNGDFQIGGDDGHDDLCSQLIWQGKDAVDRFLRDPKTALELARSSLDDAFVGMDFSLVSMADDL